VLWYFAIGPLLLPKKMVTEKQKKQIIVKTLRSESEILLL